jgi:ACT domain-containing protein
MGELGQRDALKQSSRTIQRPGVELMGKSGLSKRTFYKYKKILPRKEFESNG